MMRRASSEGSRPRRFNFAATDSPSTYAMTKYTSPSGPSPTEWIGTMWGWDNRAAVSASRRNRMRISSRKASSGGRTLIAT